MSKSNANAVSSQYAALQCDDFILLYDLTDPETQPRALDYAPLQPGTVQVLAFSQIRPDRLAVAEKDKVLIFNVGTNSATGLIPGVSRTLTSLEWSVHEDAVIATGAIDGTIAVWSLHDPVRRTHNMCSSKSAPASIAFCPTNDSIIASAHGTWVYLWSLIQPTKPLRNINTGENNVARVQWHPSIVGRLLTFCMNGRIQVWDLVELLSNLPATDLISIENDIDNILGELELLQPPLLPIAQVTLGAPIVHAEWIGKHGVFVVLEPECEILVYSYGSDSEILHEVLQLNLGKAITAIAVTGGKLEPCITYVSNSRLKRYRVPAAIIDSVGGHAKGNYSVPCSRKLSNNDSLIRVQDARPATAKMKPVKVSQTSRDCAGHGKAPQQSQKLHKTSSGESRHMLQTPQCTATPVNPSTQASKAITSWPEDPNRLDEVDEEDALMPFLSPSIPARKPSPNTLPPVDDSLLLPPSQNDSFDHLLSEAAHESDSDDETFNDGMRSSASFMPGGANVPLPKACSALFAPNNLLVTFFPQKVRPASAQTLFLGFDGATNTGGNADVARLFPSFGNLIAEASGLENDAQNDGVNDVEAVSPFTVPEFALLPLKTRRTASLSKGTAPTISSSSSRTSLVSVRDPGSISTYDHRSFDHYRILCDHHESGVDLCSNNARVAENSGLYDVARVWRLLELVLQTAIPLDVLGNVGENCDAPQVLRRIIPQRRSHSGIDLDKKAMQKHDSGILRWVDHPFGSRWLIRQLLALAEQHADLQLLAGVSAVLHEEETLHKTTSAYQSNPLTVEGLKCLVQKKERRPLQRLSRELSPIQADSSANTVFHESPMKAERTSHASSRNTSQPDTPQADSLSYTPPFAFPALSKQTSAGPVYGTGSPERYRSGFSAAAKLYAQSITEKFGSYGTSPPMKKDKLGTTTRSLDELPSSMPSSGGPWPKSVSFTSKSDNTNDSRGTASDTGAKEGYDSDKTIENVSLAHSPKIGGAVAKCTLLNKDSFSHENYELETMSLMPPDLSIKGALWCQAYAEQLRVWGALLRAVELEKISSALANVDRRNEEAQPGILPLHVPSPRSRAICNICSTKIPGLEQLCPACSHAAHLDCMDNYMSSLIQSEVFECPTGCGCNCADLPFAIVQPSAEHFVPETNAASAATMILRRTLSFTDPRRWRAKVEGNSQ